MSASPFFNEDHESIREMARDFADRTLSPIAAEVDRTDAFPLDVVKQMAELGFLGLKIPEAYGGLGLDMRSYVCAMEELARKSVTATLFLSSANSLATAPIVLSGTEAQKQAYLPGVAAGERFIAFGLTEPNAGSDPGRAGRGQLSPQRPQMLHHLRPHGQSGHSLRQDQPR